MTPTPTGLVAGWATGADVAELEALVQSAYRGDASRQGWTTEADLIEGQRIDVAMLRDLLATEGTEVLTARSSNGELVACCELARREDGVAYLGMFAVAPGLQGSGIGRWVLARVEQIAGEEWGCDRLEIAVIHLRDELLAWYARRGFEMTDETRPFPYGEERFGRPTRDDLQMVVMVKRLGERPDG